MTVQVLTGDCLEVLDGMPEGSVHTVVTSPPYWGLRNYGMPGQIGLEASYVDYVERLATVFRAVRRVLRDDGTLWLNLGDSYATGAGAVGECPGGGEQGERWKGYRGARGGHEGKHAYLPDTMGPGTQPNRMPQVGLKPKDLCMMPARVALALQEDGWYLRSDIIWSKPNPMPESVTDRPTKAHEYLFLLAKSERYYYDADAIAEPVAYPVADDAKPSGDYSADSGRQDGGRHRSGGFVSKSGNKERVYAADYGRPDDHLARGIPWEGVTRNKRTVWTVTTKPYSGAHFATFPPDLIEPCILAGCPKGGTVLDPFGGAGTTGLVADRLQRNAILIELNPAYADMARERIRRDAGMFAEVQ